MPAGVCFEHGPVIQAEREKIGIVVAASRPEPVDGLKCTRACRPEDCVALLPVRRECEGRGGQRLKGGSNGAFH